MKRVQWSVFGGYISHDPPPIPPAALTWQRTVTYAPVENQERSMETPVSKSLLVRQIERDRLKLEHHDDSIRDAEANLASLRAQRSNLAKSIEESQRMLQAIEDADRVVALETEVAELRRQLAVERSNSQKHPF